MANTLTAPEFMEALRTSVRDAGGVRAFARKSGVNQAIVCRSVNGTIRPPDSVVNAAGYFRAETFIPARGNRDAA